MSNFFPIQPIKIPISNFSYKNIKAMSNIDGFSNINIPKINNKNLLATKVSPAKHLPQKTLMNEKCIVEFFCGVNFFRGEISLLFFLSFSLTHFIC